MGVGIFLKSYVDKRGRQALILKCRHKSNSFTKSLGILVKSSDWNSRTYRIKNAIPSVAKKLADIRENAFNSWDLYEAGGFTFQELTRRLDSASGSNNSVISFVRTAFSVGRSQSTVDGYLGALNSFRVAIEVDEVSFNHISYSYISEGISKWKQKGLSPNSINSYVKSLAVIQNEGFKRGLLSEGFTYHKRYRQKVPTTIIQTSTPTLFREAISKVKDIKDFQALALYLLQFTMRGMYTSDLATMHLFKRVNEDTEELNRYVLHKRSKTGEPMDILYSCKPTESLILTLQNSFYITHQDRPEMMPNRLDPLQLLQYDYSNHITHQNAWATLAKKCSKLLMPFKTARKTFESYALMLEVSSEIRYKLLGHTDSSIKRHYQNWKWEKLSKQVDAAHLEVLKEFQCEKLFNELLARLEMVTDLVTTSELTTIHLTNKKAV